MTLTPTDHPPPAQAITALERFVVDNDDLAELEAEIGRFNVFDALRVVRQEIRHSNFLAWLLDPAESHGQGQVFLRAVLMDLLRQAPAEARPLSPVELDGEDLAGVEVRREWQHIDLLVLSADPKIVIAVENKVLSAEHSGQLGRYRKTVARHFPDHRAMFVFLTREGDEPSDAAWTPYSYEQLHDALRRCRRLHADSLAGDAGVFLDHYLRIVRSRFMSDERIDELCDLIYRKHRQALDLIFERKGDPRAGLARAVMDHIRTLGGWFVGPWGNTGCNFVPPEWLAALPPIAGWNAVPESGWVYGELRLNAKRATGYLRVVVGKTIDPDARQALTDKIFADGDAYGFAPSRREATDVWTRVYTKQAIRNTDALVDDDETRARLLQQVDAFIKTMHGMTPLLREVFADPSETAPNT